MCDLGLNPMDNWLVLNFERFSTHGSRFPFIPREAISPYALVDISLDGLELLDEITLEINHLNCNVFFRARQYLHNIRITNHCSSHLGRVCTSDEELGKRIALELTFPQST